LFSDNDTDYRVGYPLNFTKGKQDIIPYATRPISWLVNIKHATPLPLSAGVGWPEDRNTTHWLENRGAIPAVEISVDIVRQQ
jgi:hypothetical protein